MRIKLTRSEAKQVWQRVAVGQLGVLVPEFVKVAVSECFKRKRSGRGIKNQKSRHKIDGFFGRPRPEDSVPGQWLYLGEPVLFVLGIHR